MTLTKSLRNVGLGASVTLGIAMASPITAIAYSATNSVLSGTLSGGATLNTSGSVNVTVGSGGGGSSAGGSSGNGSSSGSTSVNSSGGASVGVSIGGKTNTTGGSSGGTSGSGSTGGQTGDGGSTSGKTGGSAGGPTSGKTGGSTGGSTSGKTGGKVGAGGTSSGKTGGKVGAGGSVKVHAGGSTSASGGTKTSGHTGATAGGKGHVGGSVHIGAKGSGPVHGTTSAHSGASGQVGGSVQAGGSGSVGVQIPPASIAHDKISLAAYHLETALAALGVDQQDYIYAYLQSIAFKPSEIAKIQANAVQMTHLFVGLQAGASLSAQLQQTAWQLYIESMNEAHIQVEVLSGSQPMDVVKHPGSTPTSIQLRDTNHQLLGTIPVSHVTPVMFTESMQSLQTAVISAQTLHNTGKFVPAPYGVLPKTSTSDPFLLVLGLVLAAVGAGLFIPTRKLARRMK